MTWISSPTTYLNDTQKQNNALLVRDFFIPKGWTYNAIAGMLGNMEVESTINPGLWQGRTIPENPYTAEKGYGLTQWDPARKMINWADENGLDYMDGNTQCARIQYEMENELQWSTNNILDYTFQQYHVSTESPETLARVFVWGYERPADPDIDLRQQNARKWYDYITTHRNFPVWLLFKFTGRGIIP